MCVSVSERLCVYAHYCTATSRTKLSEDKASKKLYEEKKKQAQIIARLGLPPGEQVLRQVKGARPLGPSRRKVGTILLFQRFLCFYNKTFGMETKVRCTYRELLCYIGDERRG